MKKKAKSRPKMMIALVKLMKIGLSFKIIMMITPIHSTLQRLVVKNRDLIISNSVDCGKKERVLKISFNLIEEHLRTLR